MKIVAFIAVGLSLLAADVTARSVEKFVQECKDRPNVNCHLVHLDGDCKGHTREVS